MVVKAKVVEVTEAEAAGVMAVVEEAGWEEAGERDQVVLHEDQ